MTELERLFTRDGHVSELTLARLEAGELDPRERAAVEAKLADDPISRAWLDELRGFTLAPPRAEVIPITRRSSARTTTTLALIGLALAAGIVGFVVTRPRAPTIDDAPIASLEPSPATDDGIRLKGSSFAFELWIDDGARTFRAKPGAEVHAGDKLAFRVYPRIAGELLIVCIDPLGHALACHPTPGASPSGFASVAARGDALSIVPGLAFDATPGDERFVALLCQDPPPIADVLAAVVTTTAPSWPTCELESLAVRKATP